MKFVVINPLPKVFEKESIRDSFFDKWVVFAIFLFIPFPFFIFSFDRNFAINIPCIYIIVNVFYKIIENILTDTSVRCAGRVTVSSFVHFSNAFVSTCNKALGSAFASNSTSVKF